MRLLGKYLSGALYIMVLGLVVFAILANFVVIAQSLFSPLNVVQGDSMSPSIKSNDAVLVTSVANEDLKEGDVVVYRDPEVPDQNIMHRIVAMEDENGSTYVTTKGDNNNIDDPFLVPASRIWGKVRFVLPGAGTFLTYLKSRAGFITCVISPFALLLVYLIAKCYLEKHESESTGLARQLIPSP